MPEPPLCLVPVWGERVRAGAASHVPPRGHEAMCPQPVETPHRHALDTKGLQNQEILFTLAQLYLVGRD